MNRYSPTSIWVFKNIVMTFPPLSRGIKLTLFTTVYTDNMYSPEGGRHLAEKNHFFNCRRCCISFTGALVHFLYVYYLGMLQHSTNFKFTLTLTAKTPKKFPYRLDILNSSIYCDLCL